MTVTQRGIAQFSRVRGLGAMTLLVLLAGCKSNVPERPPEEVVAQAEEKPPAGSIQLKGAGSTFASLLFARWFKVYHSAHPDIYITYDAVGSGEGVRRFIGKNVAAQDQVDFGASDSAMSDTQIASVNNDVVMVPATAGCVVLAYNLPEVKGTLRLSRKAYAGIFLGEITRWNDPLVTQSNPGVKLPDLTIVTVVRQDRSGTTFALTKNLDAINHRFRERYRPADYVNWSGAMRADGNEGVAGLIEKSTGSIGYVGYEFARRIGLDMASLENRDGMFVKPTEPNCVAALATADIPENLRVFVPDPAGAESYPIVTFSWILLRKSYRNPQTAEALRSLVQWSLQDGQDYAPDLGYVQLPAIVAEKAMAAVNTVEAK